MVDQSRIDTLRRRVREDPASVAFAALAEEYRRGGLLTEAVDTCRAGLERHPAYISARVTLARALAALGELDAAAAEYENVIEVAPENLAAQRGLAELCLRRDDVPRALDLFRAAAVLAPQDTELRETVATLEHRMGDRAVPPGGPTLHLVSDEDLPGEWSFLDTPAAARQVRALERFLTQIRHARPTRAALAASR